MEIVYSHGVISPEEVIKFLSFTGQAHSVCAEIIKNKEVIKKAKELEIAISDEQLQHFADEFRAGRQLHSAGETLNYLENAGITEEDFEGFCESVLLTAAVKEHLADEKKVRDYFINNRSEFDRARVSIILVWEKGLAEELAMQVNEDGEDFRELARKYSVDELTKYSGGYLGFISRDALSPEASAKVFHAAGGDILGPFQNEGLFQLILVEEVIEAELNEKVKEAIKEKIFEEWVFQFLQEGVKVTL